MKKMFVSVLAQYSNLGDLVIRRYCTDLAREIGELHLLADGCPKDWLDGLGLQPEDKVYTAPGAWLRALLRSRSDGVLVYSPGEFRLGRRDVAKEAANLIVQLVARTVGCSTVRLQRSVVGKSGLSRPIHRLACRKSDYVAWRDLESATWSGTGRVLPDVAFTVPNAELGLERNVLVISIRPGSDGIPPEFVDLMKQLTAATGLRPTVLSQVAGDDEAAIALGAELDCAVVTRGSDPYQSFEKTVTELYGSARLVVSNRLHVVILALTQGAAAVCVTREANQKLRRNLEVVGLEDVVFVTADFDVRGFVECLSRRQNEQIERTEAARRWVEQERTSVAAWLRGCDDSSPRSRRVALAQARLVVLQLAMGAYRQEFLDAIDRQSEGHIVFLVGDEAFGNGVRTGVHSDLVHRTGRNVYLLGRRIGFQRRVLRAGIAAPRLVIELNPRLLTSWIILGIRFILGRPTAAWGHAHARSGPGSAMNRIRRVMQTACSEIIAYTDSERDVLQEIFPGKPISVAYNALYSASRISSTSPTGANTVLIGRLTDDKKPRVAIESFLRAAPRLPPEARLLVVGVGPLATELADLATAHPEGHRLKFLGSVTDVGELQEVFDSARATIAGGYVGLNVTQSLGFGVPMVYPLGEPHAPEFEALDSSNSVAYRAEDPRSGADALIEAYSRSADQEYRQKLSSSIRETYSSELMAKPFLDLMDAAR